MSMVSSFLIVKILRMLIQTKLNNIKITFRFLLIITCENFTFIT